MPMRALALLLLLASLAGCADSESPDATMEHGHHDGGSMADKPEWQVGQYWSYVDAGGTEFDLVVVADEGSNWLVLNSDLGNAMFDWLFDVSFLGPIQKSDLSGKQGADTVKFFDFPLEHDKSWMTDWDGERRHVVAHALEDGTWHIAVHAGGESGANFAEMGYDPAIGWFDSMIFYDDAGNEQYVLSLTGSGTDFVGNVHRYTEVEHAVSINTTGPANPTATVPIDEGVREVVAWTTIDCGATPGAVGIGMQEPQDDGTPQVLPPVLTVLNAGVDTLGHFDQCPAATGEYMEMRDDPKPGVWRVDGVVAGSDQRITFDVELRTYETFTF
mgnify:CR=1 FL=1